MEKRLESTLEAIASHRLPQTALIIFAVLLLATLIASLAQNVYLQLGETAPKGLASIDVWKTGTVIGTAGTATAFLVTLYVAQRNYLRSREHIPHLTMNLYVTRVAVSKNFDVIVASLEAKNTGSSLCIVQEVNWATVVVSPYDDETVEQMVKEFESNTHPAQEEEFPWHEVAAQTVGVNLLIEPGETEQLTQEIMIKSDVEATITSAYVANASEPKLTEGWYRRTIHIPTKE